MLKFPITCKIAVYSLVRRKKACSINRKKDVILQIMRGESIDALSHELGFDAIRLFR